MKIEKGQKVKLHYTGTLDDGQVFDSSNGKEPLEFIVGSGMVIKGFDDAVIGMQAGNEKKFIIESKDAYGDVVKELMQDVPKEAFGEEKPEIGATIGIKTPDGQVMPVKVVAVKDDKVTLDLNHPLAGKRLTFEIKIVDVENLTKEELEELKHQSEHHHHGHGCEHGCEHEHRHEHKHGEGHEHECCKDDHKHEKHSEHHEQKHSDSKEGKKHKK